MIDGLLLYHLKKELNDALQKGRLEKIIQYDDDIFGLSFYRFGEKHHLVINVHPKDFAIYLTDHTFSKSQTTQFLQSLKKELTGAILENVTQYKTDRVLLLEFVYYDLIEGPQQKILVFEAMGKFSNLILIKDHIIIDTYKKMFFENGRQLLPHAAFEFFPSDKEPFTHFSFEDITYPKAISNRYMGISQKTSSYLYEQHLSPLKLPIKPTIDLELDDAYVADIFDDKHQKSYPKTISQLFDRPKKARKNSKLSYEQFIDKQLIKYQRKADQLYEQQLKNEENLKAKDKGDAVYQSLLPLNEKHSSIEVDGNIILLDPTLTLNENAQRFYQTYQKAKRGINPIKHQIHQNNDLISLFQDYKTYLSISDGDDLHDFEIDLIPYGYKTKTKSKSHKKVQKPHITILKDDDATYFFGKNDKQNAYVTHELAHANDLWFHVKDAPGGHLIVQTNELTEKVLRKAAMLAAYHSSLYLSSSIPVDYTKVRNIKKIPKTPGYRVIYTNQKTIYIDIDEEQIKTWLNL